MVQGGVTDGEVRYAVSTADVTDGHMGVILITRPPPGS